MYHLSLINPNNLNSAIKPEEQCLTVYNLKSQDLVTTSIINLIKKTCLTEALINLYFLSSEEISRLDLNKEPISAVNYFIGKVNVYAYKIKATGINKKLNFKSQHPDRNEIAINGGIPTRDIIYYRKVTFNFPSGIVNIGQPKKLNPANNLISGKGNNIYKSQLLRFKTEIIKHSGKESFSKANLGKLSLQAIIFKALFARNRSIFNTTSTGKYIRYMLNDKKYYMLKEEVTPKNKQNLKYRHLRIYALGFKQQYNNNEYGTEAFFTNIFKRKSIDINQGVIISKKEIRDLIKSRYPDRIGYISSSLREKINNVTLKKVPVYTANYNFVTRSKFLPFHGVIVAGDEVNAKTFSVSTDPRRLSFTVNEEYIKKVNKIGFADEIKLAVKNLSGIYYPFAYIFIHDVEQIINGKLHKDEMHGLVSIASNVSGDVGAYNTAPINSALERSDLNMFKKGKVYCHEQDVKINILHEVIAEKAMYQRYISEKIMTGSDIEVESIRQNNMVTYKQFPSNPKEANCNKSAATLLQIAINREHDTPDSKYRKIETGTIFSIGSDDRMYFHNPIQK